MFAVAAKAGRDDYQQYAACMGNNRNSPRIVAIKMVHIVVEDLDGRIFTMLGDITRFPNIEKDAVKATN